MPEVRGGDEAEIGKRIEFLAMEDYREMGMPGVRVDGNEGRG
jgi:hypothetical protein